MSKKNSTNVKSINPNNVVIIRAWYPTYYGKTVSYPEAWGRRTFTPSDNHAHIGHLAMSIIDGDRKQYISLFPTESYLLAPSPAINNTLEADIKEQENLPPTVQVVLFSLDTKKMLDKYDEIKNNVGWYLFGNKLIFNANNDNIYNCSSYIDALLAEGGLYDQLLSPADKLKHLVSPVAVCELAQKAAQIEATQYPERQAVLDEYLQGFISELLAKSQDPQNPCLAVNEFLQENPDSYVLVNQYAPHALPTTLPLVYDNIQTHHNERLLKLAENYSVDDALYYFDAIEKLLEDGANLSAYNEDGYNALSLMIKNNSCVGVDKLLSYFPQAVNYPGIKQDVNQDSPIMPLALAKAGGNQQMIDLIQKHLDASKTFMSNLHCSLFQNKNNADERMSPSSEVTNAAEKESCMTPSVELALR